MLGVVLIYTNIFRDWVVARQSCSNFNVSYIVEDLFLVTECQSSDPQASEHMKSPHSSVFLPKSKLKRLGKSDDLHLLLISCWMCWDTEPEEIIWTWGDCWLQMSVRTLLPSFQTNRVSETCLLLCDLPLNLTFGVQIRYERILE